MMHTATHEHDYEELAARCDRQQEARQRDIFLVLAADAALAAGHPEEAERLRWRLLQLSPHSLLRPYASFAAALQARDIQDYIADLRRLFPPEQAEKMLRTANGKNSAAPAVAPPAPIYRMQEEAPPRREQTPSPYAPLDPPLPPGPGSDVWGGWIALLLCFLVCLAAVSLSAYVLVRPLL